MIILFL